MEKKIVVLVHPGLPYRKTIKYGCQRAREMNAKLTLLAIIPEMNETERMSLALYESAPYETISRNMESEAIEFLDRAVQYCLDSNMTVETLIERGSLEDVIRRTAGNANTKLIVMPTATQKKHHSSFLHAISQFAHNMLDHELSCPVVTVVAT
jgi:nucleotide-binding universal stress UspA family protein